MQFYFTTQKIKFRLIITRPQTMKGKEEGGRGAFTFEGSEEIQSDGRK